MKKALFIDRDGTIVKESPPTYQLDSFHKLEFYPGVFKYLGKIAEELNYQLIMVTNQDGLGTEVFPEDTFWPVHHFIIKSFEKEGIIFNAVHIDRTYPHDNAPTRKPGTAMLKEYLGDPIYNIPGSFVIGDRITDVQLAKNLGCKAIWLKVDPELGGKEVAGDLTELKSVIALETKDWCDIYSFLKLNQEDEV